MTERGRVDVDQVSAEALHEILADHPAAAELVIARGLFASPSPQVPDDLYAKVVQGKVRRERGALRLEKGSTVTTDTYFGLVPASYFQRWTDVTEIRLKLAYDAPAAARLDLRASDVHGNPRTIGSVRLDGAGTVGLVARVNEFVDGGSLWIDLHATDGPLSVAEVEWTVASPATIRPAAVVICTFNRPEACAGTLSTIADDNGVLAGIDAVYVIDQGTDPVGDHPGFIDVADALGEKLIYLRQPNLGGSGGFTRGLYEVSRITEHANVILMDDDILCEPESALRLNAFANLTPTPTIVGAQMLFLKNPRVLLAGAEIVDLATLRGGRWGVHGLNNADVVDRRQNRRTDARYNAWWTCLIPAEIVAAAGLPFPFFVRWDDIEYGLRASEAGFPTVSLPNAGVWHADFHWKDSDDWVMYFDVRNALITAALHGGVNVQTAAKTLRWHLATRLVSMQYGLAHTIIRAIEDFLKGPSVLQDGGIAALAGIRAVRSEYPETVVHPAVKTGELTGVATPPTMPSDRRNKRPTMLMFKRIIQQWTGRAYPGPVTINAPDSGWWHVSRFDYAVVTDASQTGVRIRRRDEKKLKDLTWQAFRTLRRFRADAAKAQQSYRDAFPRLVSRANWASLYGIGEDD
jgi:galactofuranosylgalactofuranosylrhamnosyl-N-acetylglucosaminyl-diphospho-decaprenol beta-1,5/1,6-galactofuranosyltransferase